MRFLLIQSAVFFLCVVAALPVFAAGTDAGTTVTNQVTVEWSAGGVAQPDISTSASFSVAQLVQATLTWQDASEIQVPAGARATLRFQLTNVGNGQDSFTLAMTTPAAPAPNFTPNQCTLYLDQALTQAYQPGVNDPVLQPDDSTDIFINCYAPAQTQPGSHASIALEATSTTLSGANQAVCISASCSDPTQPAQVLTGVWAVTNNTAGMAEDSGDYLAISPAFDFTIDQQVTDTSGGGSVIVGSTVTYTLRTTATGMNTAFDARVINPIPNHTDYKIQSISLDGVQQTDAQDGDSAHYDAANQQIVVELGDYQPNDPTHVITFQVIINNS